MKRPVHKICMQGLPDSIPSYCNQCSDINFDSDNITIHFEKSTDNPTKLTDNVTRHNDIIISPRNIRL